MPAAILLMITIWGYEVPAAQTCICPYCQEALNAKHSQQPNTKSILIAHRA